MLAYRVDTLFILFSSASFIVTSILSLRFVFDEIPLINGYSFDKLFMYIIVGQLWFFSISIFLRKSFHHIAVSINRGTLDMYLTKPLRIRILTPFLEMDINFVWLFLVTMCIFIFQSQYLNFSLMQVFLSILFFLNAFLITYSFLSISITLNFWIGRSTSFFRFFMEFPDLVQIPSSFFPGLLKGIFIFILPIIVMINPSVQILYGELEPLVAYGAIFVSVALFIIAEVFWRIGLRSYTSAN